MDNFNDDLIFNLNDEGPIFYWDFSAGFTTRAVLLSSLFRVQLLYQLKQNKPFLLLQVIYLLLGCSEYSQVDTAGISINSITRVAGNRVATVTTASSHNLETGDYVTMSGQQPKDYLGDYQITVTSGTTFTYTMLSAPCIKCYYSWNLCLQ